MIQVNKKIENPDFYIPETISSEARRELSMFTLSERNSYTMPAADDLEGWQKELEESHARNRELSLEIVNQYQPLLKKTKFGGVPVVDIKPRTWKNNHKALIYIHGGAYTFFDAESTFHLSVPIAHESGLRTVSVSYTTAPFSHWNEILNQVVAVVEELVAQGYTYSDIALYGDSAGGGLAAGATLKMRDTGKGMPAALILWSPWSDITETGDTYITLQEADPILIYDKSLEFCASAYADPQDQKNPYVSPVYADYTKGFPPTLIQGGSKEIFLSNFIRHYQALDQAGIAVKLDLYEGMWHVFQGLNPNLPESRLARQKMIDFINKYLEI